MLETTKTLTWATGIFYPFSANLRHMSESSHTEKKIILISFALILAFATWIRWPGLNYGMPYFYLEDEAHHFNRVVDMVKKGEFNPHYFHKPSLHFYLRMPVVVASFFWTVREGNIRSIQQIRTHDPYGLARYAFTASHPGIVKWNRAFSLVLGLITLTLTGYLAFLISGRIYSAGIASLLMAVSADIARYDTIIGVDVVMTLFVVLTAVLALRTLRNFTWSTFCWCAFSAGLAVSSKYNAAPVLILPLLTALMCNRRDALSYVLALLIPAIGFFAGTPYALVEFPLFLDQFAYEIWHYGVAGHVGHQATPGIEQALFYIRWLASSALGIAALILALSGSVLLVLTNKKLAAVLISYPFLFFLLMISQKANFTRNMLSLIPFLAALAGYALYTLSLRLLKTRQTWTLIFLAGITILQPLWKSVEQRYKLVHTSDSRNALVEIIRKENNPFSEIAVAGQLQLPPDVYKLPHVSVFNQKLINSFDLYLSGFDRVAALDWSDLPLMNSEFLRVERDFPGAEAKQRILRNPHIKLYRFGNNDQFITAVENYLSGKGAYPAVLLYPNRTDPSKREQHICRPELKRAEPAELSESWCWFERRVDKLVLWPGSIKKKGGVTLELMSPWPNQQITFKSGEWTKQIDFKAQKPGEWFLVKLAPEPEDGNPSPEFRIYIKEVHSPAKFLKSTDSRRLGVAVRYYNNTRPH
ncbi:MAG: hypothetical protein D6719_09495 [Candidatus Dadabacteria bacterium]|nr:MAG: hypothetical protein D6719_09495 [Candidatus Dadabacteria bacterium]